MESRNTSGCHPWCCCAVALLAPYLTFSMGVAENGWRTCSGRKIPWNVWSPKVPFRATVVANHRPIAAAKGQMTHVTLSHHGKVPFLEGQSLGVMESRRETGAPSLRLHPIASSRLGDDQRSKTLSLCVKCRADGEGLSSLCKLKLGDKVNITGPVGTAMLLPAQLTDAILILVATDEGVAPFRGYLRWLFHDRGEPRFGGVVWLFFGYAAELYDKEFRSLEAKFTEFRYVGIRQPEDLTLGIQQRMGQDAEELWRFLQMPSSHLYISGPKALEETVSEVFQAVASEKPQNWMELRRALRQQGRYHCE